MLPGHHPPGAEIRQARTWCDGHLMASKPFHILAVCTANICRSPATETLLRRALHEWSDSVTVSSAGLWTPGGFPACDLSVALVGQPGTGERTSGPELPAVSDSTSHDEATDPEHTSQPITLDAVRGSDLILTMDRIHRAEIATIDPPSRRKAFTLRQAAQLSAPILVALNAGELPEGAAQLPPVGDPAARLRWLADELDAGRGLAPVPPAVEVWDPADIPDPHVVGYQLHGSAIELIESSVADIVSAMRAVLEADLLGTT